MNTELLTPTLLLNVIVSMISSLSVCIAYSHRYTLIAVFDHCCNVIDDVFFAVCEHSTVLAAELSAMLQSLSSFCPAASVSNYRQALQSILLSSSVEYALHELPETGCYLVTRDGITASHTFTSLDAIQNALLNGYTLSTLPSYASHRERSSITGRYISVKTLQPVYSYSIAEYVKLPISTETRYYIHYSNAAAECRSTYGM